MIFLILRNMCVFCLSFSMLDAELPTIVDYGSYKCKFSTAKQDEQAWKCGYYAFNCAPEIGQIIALLKREHQIDTAIETGTFRGGTTVYLSFIFDHVHTIEIDQEYHRLSSKGLKQYQHVQCHLGDSEKILKEILPQMTEKKVLFYLDAHWNDHWPLLGELEAIGQTHKDNCIIVIDDIKVPGRKNIPYDVYGIYECSYDYLKSQLDKVFTKYSVHYIIPKVSSSRAKMVVIPKA